MTINKLPLILLFLISITHLSAHDTEVYPNSETLDTIVSIDYVEVSSIKQGLTFYNKPITSSIINRRKIEECGIFSLKNISELVPNLYMPEYGSRITSSVYIRGLGARIDQPVIGLNVDNVPILSKDNFDFEMADVERIEVLRGPQSTLFGRNTMGGLINVYTISPLSYQGTRVGIDYGNGNSWKVRASSYNKLGTNLGLGVSGYFSHTDGFFTNVATDEKLDWESIGGARFRLQWRGDSDLAIDNTFSFSVLKQGGYAYALIDNDEIDYNDPSSFDRTNISYGLTIRKDYDKFSISGISSYHYTDNIMTLDNDFRPVSYFTLQQKVKEHNITEDIVIKSQEGASSYSWLFGAFGFFKHTNMDAPVTFKEDGINDLILSNANEHDPEYNYEWLDKTLLLESRFKIPNYGFALYHQSEYSIGHWNFTAGVRVDYETSTLKYNNYTNTNYQAIHRESGDKYPANLIIDNNEELKQSFIEVLPKVSVLYKINSIGSLYGSISKGYKAGGFNTQMFSDVLQQQMMSEISGMSSQYNAEDIVKYKPEYSWNYEIGGNFLWRDTGIKADFALFYIDCRDQQLTIFPEGMTTGRMMTNAGQTRNYGVEFSLNADITDQFTATASYGYTNAKFVDYKDGKNDYKGKYVPYAPRHTLSTQLRYSIPLHKSWGENLVINAGIRGIGKIYWDESNTTYQGAYALLDSSIFLENSGYSIGIWGKNLTNTDYSTYYFKSIGNSFTHKGRPQTFGVTLNINL